MAGAIAGTAILNANKSSNILHTITLTINNNCNYKCPHCYLQYKSKKNFIGYDTLDSIFKSNFVHLAIVGQEPLYNKESIELFEKIVNLAIENSKTISLVTNGSNLIQISPNIIKNIDFIDISFDGGPQTYSNFRNHSFDSLIKGIDYLKQYGVKKINALHTLYQENINYIDDLIAINKYAEFSNIMFSPYLITENHGANKVNAISISDILNTLNCSRPFLNTNEAFILIDKYHLDQDNISLEYLNTIANNLKLYNKIKVFSNDPLYNGIIRVTFDDIVLTPGNSLHTKHYNNNIIYASNSNLNQVYKEFVMKKNSYEYIRT
jgi:sulfatase maturation enzyme AslB (radical SAM superfamily)